MKAEDLIKANEGIKLMPIKGKDYAPVSERIRAFRSVYPDGRIITELLQNDYDVALFKATIYTDNGMALATGYAMETKGSSPVNRTSFLENCETSAVGRALGFCGFGLTDGVATAEEMINAEEKAEELKRQQPIGPERAEILEVELKSRDVNILKLLEQYGVQRLQDLTEEMHRDVIKRTNKSGSKGKAD